MPGPPPRALLFDVFGTCVDWRGSIVAEGRAWNARLGASVDWAAFADDWRGRYQPALEEVRAGRRPWTILDVLHRESLDALAPSLGLDKLDEAARDHLNRVWHRLGPRLVQVPKQTGKTFTADHRKSLAASALWLIFNTTTPHLPIP